MKKIPVSQPFLDISEAKAIYDVVASGWLSMGPKVKEFEDMFAGFIGVKHAIAMGNGTQTLHAILAALNVGPGDEVIVPTLNYISAANVVLYQGAKLVLCDNHPLTFNTTVLDVEPHISKKTKAIMPVDMNGLPIDYEKIISLEKKYNLPIIADSAESFGAIYKDKFVGKQVSAHSFSFFPNKNITTGEGGMITTNNDELAKELRILRNQGQEGRYNHTHLGFNYRMTELQAAIGIEQFKKIKMIIKDKNRIVEKYNSIFSLCSFIKTPFVPDYVTQHAWFMYAILLDENIDRDMVIEDLSSNGIETRICFRPIHCQPYYKKKFNLSEFKYPNSYKAYKKLINLPIWYSLPDEDIEYIAEKTIAACTKQI